MATPPEPSQPAACPAAHRPAAVLGILVVCTIVAAVVLYLLESSPRRPQGKALHHAGSSEVTLWCAVDDAFRPDAWPDTDLSLATNVM